MAVVANEKISLMPAAAPLTGAELIPMVQNGQNVSAPASILGGAVTVSSSNNSILSSALSNALNLQVNPAYIANLNLIGGQFTTYANLPSAAANSGSLAVVTGGNLYISNGTIWQDVNLNGIVPFTAGPQTAAATSVPYTLQLQAVGGIGALTYSKVPCYTNTNSWAISSSGALTGTPGSVATDAIMYQVTDSTGRSQQTTITIQTVASLSPTAAPTFSPVAGSYGSAQTVAISSATAGALIYYTTNGSPPSLASPSMASGGTITVSISQTVKALALAAGDTQSSVSSAAYTINLPSLNPLGVNFSAGGSSALEYMALPLCRNQLRSGRGWTTGANETYASINSSGWPDGTQSTATTLLYTGKTTGLALQSWFYNFTTSTYRGFPCGFTGSGAETVVGIGCVISSLVQSGANTTFTLTPNGSTSLFGFTINNITVALSAAFANLPDYPAGESTPWQVTTEAGTFYSQFAYIRFMWLQQAAFNSLAWTAANYAANKNSFSNTQCQKGWGKNVAGADGYPYELGVNLCVAANTGGWFHAPVSDDGTYATAMANYLYTNMPVGKPIYIEFANELWNGAYSTGVGASNNGTLSLLAQAAGYPATALGMYQYLGVKLHALASIFRGVFGARFNTDLRIVLCSQAGGNGPYLANGTLANMVTLGYTPSADIWMACVAPYIQLLSPVSTWTVGQIEANLAGTDGSANPSAANTIAGTAQLKGLATVSAYYGLKGGIGTYEGMWAPTNSGITNTGAAIMDSGMTAVEQAVYANCLNTGIGAFTRFEGGCTGLTTLSGLGPNTNFDYSFANMIAGNSPRFKAMQPYFSGGYVPTGNVVSGSGSAISALQYEDYTGTTYPIFSHLPSFAMNGSQYLFSYDVVCLKPGTYSLSAYFTNTSASAQLMNVRLNGVTVITGASIPGSITNQSVALGYITLPTGGGTNINELTFGTGAYNPNLTLGSALNGGRDIYFT